MKNITYLLGAGASYHSLPLLATMNKRMQAFSLFLKAAVRKKLVKNDFAPQFIKDLDELIKAESESTSIDAYAKELSNSNKQMKLLHLKAILSSYLIFEQLFKTDDFEIYSDEQETKLINVEILQSIKNPIDKRYRTFWGEYIDHPKNLPQNVKVLSWNYDMQLETSFSRFSQYSLGMVQQELQVFPSEQKQVDTNKFCVLKLNGTAGLINPYDRSNLYNLFDFNKHSLDSENINYLIELLSRNYHRAFNNPVLNFAWENENMILETRKLAKKIISKTEILVIIGYSFPSFNWTVDQEIFSDLGSLEKVYYQVPKSEMEELKIQMEAINPYLKNKTIGISNLNTFFVPPEKQIR